MSRCRMLVEKYRDGEETVQEAEELARLVREEPRRAGFLYEALMLEANLYEIHDRIGRIHEAQRVPGIRFLPRLVTAWAIAVFMLVGLAVLLLRGTPSPPPVPQPAPAAPRPSLHDSSIPVPAPFRESSGDHGSKREEIEREYRKGLREVERKRLEGKNGEADKKLRELEREREKQLRELEQRTGDR